MRPDWKGIAAHRAKPGACAIAALALVLIAPVGCDSASSEPQPKPKADPLHTYQGRVIRGWLLALERQDY